MRSGWVSKRGEGRSELTQQSRNCPSNPLKRCFQTWGDMELFLLSLFKRVVFQFERMTCWIYVQIVYDRFVAVVNNRESPLHCACVTGKLQRNFSRFPLQYINVHEILLFRFVAQLHLMLQLQLIRLLPPWPWLLLSPRDLVSWPR